MTFYGIPATETSTPLAIHDPENRRVEDFVFPRLKQRDFGSKTRNSKMRSSMIVLTGSENSIVSLSDFPMPPTTTHTNRRRKPRQRVLPIFAPVTPLRIVKRSPKIVPQASPETSLAASVVASSDEGDNVCLATILAELKALEKEPLNQGMQQLQTSDNRNAGSTIPAVEEPFCSTAAAQAEPSVPISTSEEDVEMSDVVSTPVAGTTAPPPYSTLGLYSDTGAWCETNKENIDPNGIAVWPRPPSGNDKATNPLRSATNDITHAYGPAWNRNSCPSIPDLAPTAIPSSSSLTRISSSKFTKSHFRSNKAASLSSICRKNFVSSSTKARHRGNVVLESYIYHLESRRSNSPSLSPSNSSYSYPDFSTQSEMMQPQSVFGDMTLVGIEPTCGSKFDTCTPSIPSSTSIDSKSSGGQWFDVFNLSAYMED